jgi:PilZ domain
MPGVLQSGKKALRGTIVDISVGGALFEPERARVRLPGPCLLRLPLRSATADHIAIAAEVVRTSAGRFGLRWTRRIPAEVLIKLSLPLGR